MRNRIGILLWSVGHIINLLTLLAALIYAFGAILWMHAPALAALQVVAMMALLPVGLAWLCISIGKRLRGKPLASASSPTRRWLLACIGIATVVVCASVVRSGISAYRCSADRSQNPTAYGEAETQKNGFRRVCEGDLARFDISFRSTESAARKLAFPPVDLAHTPFAQLESLGGRVEYMTDVPSILYRGFRLPDGHTLTLYEHDMSADGSSTWRNPKDEPDRINGMAARLSVMEAPSGMAVSHLSWIEGRREYQLWVDANVVRKPLRDRLFALAASLPHSVPACPHEPPPKQWRLDENGRPIDEPPPAVLTQSQIDGMLAKRPCK